MGSIIILMQKWFDNLLFGSFKFCVFNDVFLCFFPEEEALCVLWLGLSGIRLRKPGERCLGGPLLCFQGLWNVLCPVVLQELWPLQWVTHLCNTFIDMNNLNPQTFNHKLRLTTKYSVIYLSDSFRRKEEAQNNQTYFTEAAFRSRSSVIGRAEFHALRKQTKGGRTR